MLSKHTINTYNLNHFIILCVLLDILTITCENNLKLSIHLYTCTFITVFNITNLTVYI